MGTDELSGYSDKMLEGGRGGGVTSVMDWHFIQRK